MSLQVTYIGHATTLIQWDGLNILTDPVFSNRILFFKRLKPLNFDPNQLPKLDAILITHAHYDHLDLFSYKYIPSDVPILIPEGMSKAISPFVNNPIIELATWARYSLKGIDICTVPAKHQGGRLFFSLRYPKCHGYVLSKENESLYFSGDTAYQDVFRDLRSLFKFKLASLPIACHSHNRFIRSRHMNVEDCIQCWDDLGRPDWIPIHWGTFFSYLKGQRISISSLRQKAQEEPPLKEKLHILEPGETLSL